MAQSWRQAELRIGIIGCGRIGRIHLAAYRALGVRPHALADADRDALATAAAKYGGTPYADYRDMLAAEALDAVHVCTSPASHANITTAALEAGTAVLCEKPMAISVTECEAMVAAAERTGQLLTIGFCHRFQPQIERLHELATSGALGTILMLRNRFAGYMPDVEQTWFARRDVAGGGVMFDTCVHSVDLFRYLVGDASRVTAVAATTATPLGPTLDAEDTAIISLRSTTGALGVIEASWRTPPGEWIVTLYGTAGAATVDYDTEQLRIRTSDNPEWRVVDVPAGDRFERELAHFLRCVRGEEAPRVTAQDGLAAAQILAAAYESAAADLVV